MGPSPLIGRYHQVVLLSTRLLAVCKQVLSLHEKYIKAKFLVPSFVCLGGRASWSLGGKPRLSGIGQGAHHPIHHHFTEVQALISALWKVGAGILTWCQR